MTLSEQMKAQRKQNNQINTQAIQRIQPKLSEQLKAERTLTAQEQPIQRQVNPAANILQNATKVQSYNDVVPQKEKLQFKNTSFIDTSTMEQKPQTTEWNESTRQALDREGQLKNILQVPQIMKDNLRRFQDGYNFGDITLTAAETVGDTLLTAGGTALDVGSNVVGGFLELGENLARPVAAGVAQVADWVGNDEWANQVRKNIAGDKEYWANQNLKLPSYYAGKVQEFAEPASISGYYVDELGRTVGQIGGMVAGGKLLGGASAIPIKIGKHVLNVPTIALVSGSGAGAQEAYSKEGATDLQAWTKIISSGFTEGITEGIFGFMGVGGSDITDKLATNVINKISSGAGKTFAKMGASGAGEATEEFISYGLNWMIDNGIINNIGKGDFSKDWNWEEVGEQMALAFLASGITQGGTSIYNINKQTDTAIQSAEQQLGRVLTTEEKQNIKKQITNYILTEEEGQKSANILQNATQTQTYDEAIQNNVQNVPQTENISQNNVENAQNLQETGQNDTQRDFLENYETDTQRHITSNKDNIIVKNYKQLDKLVDEALKTKNNKELHLGRINETLTQKIKSKILNLPKNKAEILNRNKYDLVLHQSEIRHLKDGKVRLTDEEIHDYVRKLPEIITNFDTISYTKNNKDEGIRFTKKFEDGTYITFTLVANSKYTLTVKSISMDKADYEAKKRSFSPPNDVLTTPDNTSKTSGALASINNIIPNSENYVNNMLPTTEQLQAQDQKQVEEAYNTLNMKKPKLERIAELTEEQAQLPIMTYKQRADRNTPYRRKFWDNIESSKIVSKDVKEQVNMTNYQRKHNADVLEKMKDRLDTEPMRVVQEWFNKDIKKATEQDIALGAILLERYQAEGRMEEAVDVVEKLADMGTEAGRTVQMYSIFQRLTPEGMMVYQQRKLNSALETLTAKQTGKWVEQNKDKFKLTEDDATFITAKVQEAQNAPTERQKQIALAEIETRINDKLPPEAGQSVKAFRRIAMLFNPKTQVRNVAGNITVMPLNYVTDLVATQFDKIVAKKTGVRTTAGPNIKTIAKGFKKGASETIDDYRRGIRTTPTGSRYEIQNNAKSFNENTNSKVRNFINNKLNGIDRILSTVLELGDRPFYEAAYQNSLEAQMKANNVTEPTQDMIDIASNVALSQTWQDSNNYTQAVLGIRSAFNKININGFGLGDLIIPFAKTPANLTKAMIDYSPAGFIPSLINYNDMRKAISRGDMTPMQQKKFVTSVGKAMAGTLLYALAYGLVQGGYITGSADEDKDVANFEKNVLGIQPYSIKIGDKTFTYNWAQPLATPFAIMADAKKMSAEDAGFDEILVNSFKVAGDQLVANSFLQGIQELLSSEYGDDSPMDNLVGAIMDLPTQFTPTLFGQIATQFDKTKRQTFENGDTVGTMVNEVKNKIPGAKNTLAPQVNTFGEEIQNYGGANNPFNVFLNPGNVSSTNATDAQKELYALYEVTKDKTIFPRQAPYTVEGGGESFKLSSQDRVDYQKTSGQYVTEQLDALFDSRFYQSLENDAKADVVAKIVEDADLIAKDKWIDTKSTERIAEIQTELKESDIPIIAYYNAWASIQGVEGTKNWKGETISGSKKKNQITEINKAVGNDLTTKQKETLYGILNISGY